MLALPLGDNRAFENEPVEDIIQPLCISVAVGGILPLIRELIRNFKDLMVWGG